MAENPYERFHDMALILRDELAIDRTILANERTVLAYLRSALSLIIVGVTFLHFVERGFLLYIGMGFIPFGIAVGLWGVLRYRKMDAGIRTVRRALGDHPAANPTERTPV